MIVAITGFLDSGKGSAAKWVAEKYGFIPLSYGDAVREEADILGIPKTSGEEYRRELQKLGDRLRVERGVAFWSERLKTKVLSGKNYVIEGLRYPEDVYTLRAGQKFLLIGIDAPYELRCAPAIANNRGRLEDQMTPEKFKLADENDRCGLPGIGQQTQACFDMADVVIVNDGTMGELKYKLDEIMIRVL